MTLRFVLNGELAHVTADDPQRSLLAWLREHGRTGSKEGCAEGECGACAVALLKHNGPGEAHFEAVNSCLLPLGALADATVVTAEGMARPDGTLHPVQQALVEHGASQCGYCTPGFVVSLFCEYYRNGRVGFDPEAIAGNLCRCTGYRPILDAGRSLPRPAPDDPQLVALRLPRAAAAQNSGQQPQQSARFVRPPTLPELFRRWGAEPDARPIAGGTDLMVDVNLRGTKLPTLLSLEALEELQQFRLDAHELTLGAALTLSQIEQQLQALPAAPPLLQQLLPLFSSRLIRNRATLGGNLQTGSPIGDAAPCLLALDAELSLVSARGTRRLPLREFFLGYRQTALLPQELIASVHVPLPLPQFQRFYKLGKRTLDDISTISSALALDRDQAGRVQRLRIAYGGIAATPLRALALEQLAVGQPWSRDTIERLTFELGQLGTPQSDVRGSAEYRRSMMARLLEKFWHESSQEETAP